MHCPPVNLNYVNYVLIVSLFSFPAQQKCLVSGKGAHGLMHCDAISVTFKKIELMTLCDVLPKAREC